MGVEEKMIDIIVEQLSVDREKVVAGASFVDDLGADSLDLVELIMAMEEEFDIEIDDRLAVDRTAGFIGWQRCRIFLLFNKLVAKDLIHFDDRCLTRARLKITQIDRGR